MAQSTTAPAPTVSASGGPLFKFVVFAPDYTDEECLGRRLAVRSTHLAGAAQMKKTGQLSTSIRFSILCACF